MTIPTNWPVSWMEQSLYVAEIERRIRRLQRIKRSIVVHSRDEPSQAQFEAAYVAQTGFPLPIEVGTKLCWFDLRRGQMRAYSTAYDIQDGLYSSGQVYPMVDVDADSKGQIRLIGVRADTNTWKDPYVNVENGGMNIRLDPTRALKKGLMAYMVIFEANSAEVAFTYSVRTADYQEHFYESVYAVYNAAGSTPGHSEVNKNTGAVIGEDYVIVTPGNVSGLANVYSQGLLFFHNVVNAWEQDNQKLNTIAPNGAGFASGFLTTMAANSMRINAISFIETASSPYYPPFNLVMSGGERQKAWLYGIYNQPTGSIL
jgi:hypothetical protein